MIKLVINADDFGIDPNATAAIMECLRRGWITNTTLMVNMPSAEKAVSLARADGFIDRVGLHLNFGEGRPLTERMQSCREFCDENGVYNQLETIGIRHQWTPLHDEWHRAVEEETAAQIERYLELGGQVRHFDAHHHTHLIGRMIRPVFSVAERYGFVSVRRPENVAVRSKLKSKIYYPCEGFLKRILMHSFRFVTTDYMGAYEGFHSHFDSLHNCSFELMVHPVYLDANGRQDVNGEMIDSWTRPMKETIGFIQQRMDLITLVSFKDLQGA